jgi:hypothetical protein
MIHISDVAVDHIWDKFQKSLIDSESRQIAAQVQKVIKAANHKPLHKNTPEYVRFLQQMTEEINRLERKYKLLNLTIEKEYFKTEKDKIEQRIK